MPARARWPAVTVPPALPSQRWQCGSAVALAVATSTTTTTTITAAAHGAGGGGCCRFCTWPWLIPPGGPALRIGLSFLLLTAIATVCVLLPVDKMLQSFLLWVRADLGPWSPLVLAIAYTPLTVLAAPSSVLTVGGGYLFGLHVGFIADSIGATMGATAAFILGRTIGRSYVLSRLKNNRKFQAVVLAIERSGFKACVF
ncbi:hypothetical protein SLE2022_206950 [Rubroshorea leprosula]